LTKAEPEGAVLLSRFAIRRGGADHFSNHEKTARQK